MSYNISTILDNFDIAYDKLRIIRNKKVESYVKQKFKEYFNSPVALKTTGEVGRLLIKDNGLSLPTIVFRADIDPSNNSMEFSLRANKDQLSLILDTWFKTLNEVNEDV